MAWSIFLGKPSIKNRPFPSSHPTDLGGLLIVSLMAFSKSCQGSTCKPADVNSMQSDENWASFDIYRGEIDADLDSNLHGDDVTLSNVGRDHLAKLRTRTSLFGSEQVSSWRSEDPQRCKQPKGREYVEDRQSRLVLRPRSMTSALISFGACSSWLTVLRLPDKC
jgi:hypothetical protein